MEPDIQGERIIKDLPKALAFYKEVKDNSDILTTSVKALLNRVKSGEFNTSQGISFLELKCHMLLNYMINTSYISLQKMRGKQIEGDAAVIRLAEIRTVLERMRPIEQKLKYHIDKVIKFVSGSINQQDPLRFSANPDNLMNKLQGESSSENDSESEIKREGVKAYVPPKLAAMHYDEDMPGDERKQKALEQARKKALSSSIMRELKDEYYEGPEEIWEESSSQKKLKDSQVKQRTEYEEEYFVRLNMSKKDKHQMKKKMTMSGLDDLTHFGDIRTLTSEGDDVQTKRIKRTPNKKMKKKFKKSIKKKRH